jgi:hypothetical protein
MPKPEREAVKQSAPATRQSRLHVQQSPTHVNHLKSPAGTRREPVNQSHLKK